MAGDNTWPRGFADIVRRHSGISDRSVEPGDQVSFADLGVDSMNFLGLLADVEEMLGCEVDLEALTPEAFSSPGGLWTWLTTTIRPFPVPEGGQPGPAADPGRPPGPGAGESDWVQVLPSKQIIFAQGHGSAVKTAADLIVRVHELDGELDIARLVACIARLRAASDALRLVFRDAGGTGYMRALDPGAPVPISFLRLVRWDEQDLVKYLRLLTRQAANDWDPAASGSARWALLRLGERRHLLATWYVHVSVDVRSVSELERQLWAAYHDNVGAIEPTASVLDCARHRRRQPERCSPQFWTQESERVTIEASDTAGLSVMAERRRRMAPADLARLSATAEGGSKLSLAQVIAYRFAAAIREVRREEPVVVHYFVDERSRGEEHVAGALSGLVPVVLGPTDLGSPLACARKTVRALASRPRRPGGELPGGYVRLLTQARAYSFTYVPWRGNSVQPRFDLDVSEFPVPPRVRDPSRGRLRVVELEPGGVELSLMFHQEETPAGEAEELLDRITLARP